MVVNADSGTVDYSSGTQIATYIYRREREKERKKERKGNKAQQATQQRQAK